MFTCANDCAFIVFAWLLQSIFSAPKTILLAQQPPIHSGRVSPRFSTLPSAQGSNLPQLDTSSSVKNPTAPSTTNCLKACGRSLIVARTVGTSRLFTPSKFIACGRAWLVLLIIHNRKRAGSHLPMEPCPCMLGALLVLLSYLRKSIEAKRLLPV